MNSIKQFLALMRINLPGLTQRIGPVLTIVLGITCAVGVLVSMLAMGAGARRQALGEARPDRVILTSAGAQSTLDSQIPQSSAQIIRDTPGIAQGAHGEPVVLFEALVMAEGRRSMDGARVSFPLFGVSSGLTGLRPEVRLTAGRLFRPGLHELIATDICARRYTGFGIGDTRSIRGSDWSVVGHFREGRVEGTCTLYADADTVLSAARRDSYNRVTVMLQSAAGYAAFEKTLEADPALHLDVKRETEAALEESSHLIRILNFASYFVGAIMALGAMLGAVNSLYAIVDGRRRELATLRAIGFSPGPIVASIMGESMLLAFPGALLGAALAWLFFDGLSATPFGVSFQLAVTSSLAVLGIGWALGIGLAGGFLPALRAARLPVTTALRAV